MNLHGLDENNHNQNRRNNQNQRQGFGPAFSRFPFLAPDDKFVHPSRETYAQMMHYTLCPQFKAFSFTSIIILANTLLFGICLLDGIESQGTLLQVKESSLKLFGGMVSNQVKQEFQYQQLITSLFLTFDFMQFLIHQIIILIIASRIEYATGALVTAFIYIGGGTLGAIFGLAVRCCNDEVFLHSQTAIYTLIGSLLGFYILNFDSLGAIEGLRFMMCIIVWIALTLYFIIIMSNFRMSTSIEQIKRVDYLACLGGAMAGIFITMAIAIPMKKEGFESKASIFGWTFLSILAGLSLILIIA